MNFITTESLAGRRAALIVGHPGHELRVWGWMRAARPILAVLTDGGGHEAKSRLHLTRAIADEASARLSGFFGVLSDGAMYQAILTQNVSPFVDLADKLAALLIAEEIDLVAGDAAEGYNPTHDVCRLVIDRAVRLARRRRPVASYAIALADAHAPSPTADSLCFTLSTGEVAHKIRVARDYAAAVGGTLSTEVDDMLARFGEAAFSREYFVEPDRSAFVEASKPFYETYGERQVAAGHYAHVIRLADHVRPIADALDA